MSGDTHERQCEFVRSLEVEFPMIGDKDGEIARAYEAKRPLIHLDRRMTYVIGRDGRIAHAIQSELSMARHIDEVRAFLEKA